VDSLMEVDRDKKKKKEVNIVKNIFERRLLWCWPWLLLSHVTTTTLGTESRKEKSIKGRGLFIDGLDLY
jgi:hypothetical protein